MYASTFDPMLRALARKTLPLSMRRTLKRLLRHDRYAVSTLPTSFGCEFLLDGDHRELLRGWQDPLVAERQEAAFAPILQQMRAGNPRQDFVALVDAIRLTGEQKPVIIEVGCGSAWNAEVLARLWGRSFRYIGVDYSRAMIALAKRRDPRHLYVVGDATALPVRDRAGDVLLSGTVLMHLFGYREAIQESRRVARRWCIFHTVPVVTARPTTILRKYAYGRPVLEVVYNSDEFQVLLSDEGLRIRGVLKNISHEYLTAIFSEPITAWTYVCEIA